MRVSKGCYCSAINCSNNTGRNPELHFFTFPKDPERCKKWVINSRREDLLTKNVKYLNGNCRLCLEHFEDSQFMNSNKNSLIKNAVPTVFSISNTPKLLAGKRKPPVLRNTTSEPKKPRLKGDSQNMAAESSFPKVDLPVHREMNTCHSFQQDQKSEEIKNLKSALRSKINELSRLRKKYGNVKKQLKQQKMLAGKGNFAMDVQRVSSIASKYLSDSTLHFFVTQMKMGASKKHGRRWTDQDKLFALSILFKNRPAYEFIAEQFHLPTVKTLQNWVQGLKIHSGMNENLFYLLKEKVSSLNEQEKLVVLSMDEMALMTSVSYDSASDRVFGFEDFGEEEEVSNKVANSVLVAMVSGITTKYKQPLAYYFSNESASAGLIKKMFELCVQKLGEVGLRVKALVTDQGTNFTKFHREMNISIEKPFVEVGGDKVFVFFDTPHLLKSVRNNLNNYNIVFKKENCEQGVASWGVISELHKSDQNRQFKLVPKLTKRAVDLPAFSKMKVKLATSVLSKSVAVAVQLLVQSGLMTKDALDTAEFCQKVNDLFDIFNSSSLYCNVERRRAIREGSDSLKLLLDMKEWILSWKFIGVTDGKDKTKRIKCKNGWLMNIQALLGLWEEVRSRYSFNFLLTRRLNQDPLENLFSVIRQKGGHCSNPTPKMFVIAFKHVLFNSYLTPASTGNCAGVEWGHLFSQLKEKKIGALNLDASAFQTNKMPDLPLIGINVTDIAADVAEENAKVYVFGYILRKVLALHSCVQCEGILRGNVESVIHSTLVSLKLFKNNSNLHICSVALQNYLSKCEIVLLGKISDVIHTNSVGAQLLQHLSKIEFIEGCCDETKHLILKTFVRVRLHFILKFANREITLAGRKRRKYLKFVHLGC